MVEWSKLVGPIKAVDVNTPDATLVAKVKDAVAGVVGKPLDRGALRTALTVAIALPGVSDVGAHGTQLADGIQLVLDVTPQPTLHALVAREVGGADLPLPGQLTSAIGLPVDPALLDALGVQLRELYLSKASPKRRWSGSRPSSRKALSMSRSRSHRARRRSSRPSTSKATCTRRRPIC